MKRWITTTAIFSATILGSFGCSTCCGPFDYDYPNFGGKHERVDPQYGRLGSILSDPNADVYGPSADSNLTPPPEPLDAKRNSSEGSGLRDSLERELEDLESTDPTPPKPDVLPTPTPDDDNSTASRLWKNRPLRGAQPLR